MGRTSNRRARNGGNPQDARCRSPGSSPGSRLFAVPADGSSMSWPPRVCDSGRCGHDCRNRRRTQPLSRHDSSLYCQNRSDAGPLVEFPLPGKEFVITVRGLVIEGAVRGEGFQGWGDRTTDPCPSGDSFPRSDDDTWRRQQDRYMCCRSSHRMAAAAGQCQQRAGETDCSTSPSEIRAVPWRLRS